MEQEDQEQKDREMKGKDEKKKDEEKKDEEKKDEEEKEADLSIHVVAAGEIHSLACIPASIQAAGLLPHSPLMGGKLVGIHYWGIWG